MGRVENKTAIVTGSAQGIGATYATALAREGARVVLVEILDPSPMAATIREIGGLSPWHPRRYQRHGRR